MASMRRWAALFVALALLASACGGSTEEDVALSEVVDDLIEESEPEPAPEPEPDPEPEPEPEPAPEPEPEPEPEPPVQVTQGCLLLRHYSGFEWEEYPYHGLILLDLAEATEGVLETMYDLPSSVRFYGNEDGTSGIQIEFAVAAPGETMLPSVMLDGVSLDEFMIESLDGMSSFIAAASDFTDEYIEPIPCPMPIFIPAGNTLGPPA